MAGIDCQVRVLGFNHHQTPLELREKLALSPERTHTLRQKLAATPGCAESLVLNTCNRVEVYWSGNPPANPDEVLFAISGVNQVSAAELQTHIYTLEGLDAVQHLFQVAAGMDSQIVGETEIFGQLKTAYQEAQIAGTISSILHRLLQRSFQSAKWARTHTGISVGQVSLGNVAVELATRIFGKLTVARTLVVGSGDVGRDVAKAFRSRGVACMSIASRTTDRANDLARAVDGLIIPYSSWKAHLPYVDIAIFATSAPGQILLAREIEPLVPKRGGRPVFLIDLAVPRDVDTSIVNLPAVYLYNYDDLAEIANENLRSRATAMQDCRERLQRRAGEVWGQICR